MSEGLGDRIRRLRRELGQSQTELAGSELSASYVSLIEAGRRTPTDAALKAIAARLGTTTTYLLTGTEGREPEQVLLDLRYAGLVLLNGAPAEALLRYQEVLDSLDAERDRSLWRTAMFGVAQAQERLGNFAEAARLLEAVRAGSTPLDRDPTYTKAILALARAYLMTGDVSYATRVYELALDSVNAVGNPGGAEELSLLSGLVTCYVEAGDLVRAGVIAEQAVRLSSRLDDGLTRGEAFRQASVLARERGEVGQALDYAERALLLGAEADHDRWLPMMKVSHGYLRLMGDPAAAAEVLASLEPVLAGFEERADLLPSTITRLEIARAHLLLGRNQEALEQARRCVTDFARAGSHVQEIGALILVSLAEERLLGVERARATLRTAAEVAGGQAASRAVAGFWFAMAEQSERYGDLPAAIAAQREALRCAGVVAPVGTQASLLPHRAVTSR